MSNGYEMIARLRTLRKRKLRSTQTIVNRSEPAAGISSGKQPRSRSCSVSSADCLACSSPRLGFTFWRF